ncbi:TrkA family potassium uptake protein [Streptomyces cellulosae]|jgi:trk system potassium uptake protein TrkA|uniref:Trk system potassium uptake protein TrkA n=1 Tax=Streptomyces thermodiastaticus TaxID=44061 RepID=A0ABU0KCQ5_9ACTN|nr:TrkA family potassium uptake protein [Streptomyces cellulosae]MDQ0487161.1 trk system potassium uptake protein TrkA [Streptomyces thermodiastaticus]MYQ31792.1 TrkA family potassium uptake protein [Streptomyces sp. SID4956]UVT07898.1 TrkA family potassium uptake protein [Streptomyces thermocarboxydus]WSB39465.1 TrkA family potassium uptake protein [Streptomyces cellulosae]
MKVIVVGCGRVGSALAGLLAAEGHDVDVVDRYARAARNLPGRPRIRFHEGNGYSRPVLEDAAIGHADAFVAATSSDTGNVVAARIAKETYRVPVVLARACDPRRSGIYHDVGVPTVAGVRWSVHQMHRMLLHRHLSPELSFGNGETLLVRSDLPGYLVGRRLSTFEVDGEIRVVEVTRQGRSLIPTHGTPAHADDLVTFAVTASALGRLRAFLDKELGT